MIRRPSRNEDVQVCYCFNDQDLLVDVSVSGEDCDIMRVRLDQKHPGPDLPLMLEAIENDREAISDIHARALEYLADKYEGQAEDAAEARGDYLRDCAKDDALMEAWVRKP